MYDALYADAGQAATRYDADGSNPTPVLLIVSNYQAIKTRREASKSTEGDLPAGTLIAPGQLLQQGVLWYIVSDVMRVSVVMLVPSVTRTLLLPIPLVLTVKRQQDPALPAVLNAYDEAMTWDSTGRPIALPASIAPVTTFTVRAGLSNDNNPLTNDAGGPQPAGVRTLYVPLGADVRLGDTLVMPNGQEGTVQQVNDLDAEGVPWAYQVLVDATAGGL